METHVRSVAVNLTGYGRSPMGSFEDDVAGVVELLDEQTLLCGHSYGSFVAMHAALRRPPAAVVLLEPVCFDLLRQVGDAEGLAQLQRLEARPEFWDANNAGTDAWLSGFTEYWNGEGAWQAMSRRRKRIARRQGPKLFAEVVAAWRDDTPLAAWAALPNPRVIIGEHTTVAARRVATVLAQSLGVALEEVAGGGHMFPLTHAEAVEGLLRRPVPAG
jgi:pimeloyl-ACP methyl ester carboxylesterase